MADAADSKSVGLKTVRVQVPPPALALKQMRFRAFTYAEIRRPSRSETLAKKSPAFFPFSGRVRASNLPARAKGFRD